MVIPSGSNFPDAIDTEENLFVVHDALRMTLIEDYNPGDTSITVLGDLQTFNRFPDNGFITLIDQCSDLDARSVTLHYDTKAVGEMEDIFIFSGLEVLETSSDVFKPKQISTITMNVVAATHNTIKDAIIAIENWIGAKGTTDLQPFGETLEGRINFLHNLVLPPKAWFTADQRIGIVPFEVTFKEQAFLVGEGCPVDPVTFIWDFGDTDCSIISGVSIASVCPVTEEYTSVVPVDATNAISVDKDGGSIKKTYTKPGNFDVTLTVKNEFGEDTIIFPGFISARIAAPDEAIIEFTARAGQDITEGDPPEIPPIIRSPINTFIDIEIPEGENPETPGRSFAGELLDGSGNPLDPIVSYQWDLTDDLLHPSSRDTRASYSIGGIYDLIVRADTEFGAYRITTYEDAIDIVEDVNMWLWLFNSSTAVAHEFGLISETFKTSKTSLTVGRNTKFLSVEPNSEQQIREFKRNTFFAPRSTVNSGNGGASLLYWATGRDSSSPATSEGINVRQWSGFDDTYLTPSTNPVILRPWNWVAFDIAGSSYFLLGNVTSTIPPNTSPTNQEKIEHDLTSLSTTTTTLANSNYKNGADELQQNVASFDSSGDPVHGHFSVYRTTTKGDTGYIARNDGIGSFFRIKSFYRTEGILSNPLQDFRKLPDILGSTKLEGELVDFTSGIFFFNNSPSISAFDDVTLTWTTTGSSPETTAFSQLQDTSISGFSNVSQPLLAKSDGDRRAYLSFDYSPNAFIKFNEADLTFSSLGSRPEGEQWMMGVY